MTASKFNITFDCFQLHEAIFNQDLDSVKNLVEKINTNYSDKEKEEIDIVGTAGLMDFINHFDNNTETFNIIKCLDYVFRNLNEKKNIKMLQRGLWEVTVFPYYFIKTKQEILNFLNDQLDNPLKDYQITHLIKLSYKAYDFNTMNKLKSVLEKYKPEND